MKTVHAFKTSTLAAALILSGCNLFEEDSKTEEPGVSGTTSAWIGQPLDSLTSAGSLLLHDGRLFVANGHETSPGVAAVDTATGLITEYYPTLISPAGMAVTADGHIVVTETDYDEQAAVSVINPSSKKIRQSVISFGTDPGIRSAGGNVYLFDRTTGAVTGFSGNTPGDNVVFDVQAGANSNPYAIAVDDGKAYITRYNSNSLLILDNAGTLDGGARDSVDLSAYASRIPVDTAASAPRMSHVTAAGGYVFVTLQRLNYNYSALDTSLVVVINAATKTIEKTIPLLYRNPVSATVRDGTWYVAGVQGYGDLLGGVEKIDLTTRTHAGSVAGEALLGGDVSSFAPTGTSSGYAVYSPGWPVYKVKKI